MYGLSGTGKDTASDILVGEFGLSSYALADPIRDEYTKRFHRDDYKQNRETMILIGETYKSIYGQDVWCDAAIELYRSAVVASTRPLGGCLIRDGRYQHEYDYFVGRHGFVPLH
jgi:hypothetical protein